LRCGAGRGGAVNGFDVEPGVRLALLELPGVVKVNTGVFSVAIWRTL
jgi:hypothetical protein